MTALPLREPTGRGPAGGVGLRELSLFSGAGGREIMTTYSHRNGETTPPTIHGDFWFLGEGSYSFSEGLPAYRMAGMVLVSHSKRFFVTGEDVKGKSVMFKISETRGQWWGPITPPWVTP